EALRRSDELPVPRAHRDRLRRRPPRSGLQVQQPELQGLLRLRLVVLGIAESSRSFRETIPVRGRSRVDLGAHAACIGASVPVSQSSRCPAESPMPLLAEQANDQPLPLPRPTAAPGSARTEIGTSLPYYIARVQAIPPLSREDEYELACRMRDVEGDGDAAR